MTEKKKELEPVDAFVRCCNNAEDWEDTDENGLALHVVAPRWNHNQILPYFFLSKPSECPQLRWMESESQKAIIRQGFKVWERHIGITFPETEKIEDSLIRISFLGGKGCWSAVGKQILNPAYTGKPTMNFGIFLDQAVDHTHPHVLHEIGHTLGFPHEHQSANAGIVWDTPRVLKDFKSHYGWDDLKIKLNLFTTMSVEGSFDQNSIMAYGLMPGWVLQPESLANGTNPPGTLSAKDVKLAKKWYPKAQTPPKQVKTEKKAMSATGPAAAATTQDLLENEAVLVQKNFNRNFTAAKSANYQFLFMAQGEEFGEVKVNIKDATGKILKQQSLKGQKYVDSFLDLKQQSHYTVSVEGITSEVARLLVVEKVNPGVASPTSSAGSESGIKDNSLSKKKKKKGGKKK